MIHAVGNEDLVGGPQGDGETVETPRDLRPEWDVLRQDVLAHLERLQLPVNGHVNANGVPSKEAIRASHAHQRLEYLLRERRALGHKWQRLLAHFADGEEVRPAAIEPELVPAVSDQETGDLFRLASLCWSVPVSRGFGRRMRYLVRDRSNGKLIGIFALGDPVFNLRVRDTWIGWTVNDRRARLVNVMDGYVVGAVPPYAQILGGKLVASLIASAEVSTAFAAQYGTVPGIISGQQKGARLALVTITSALGRSSLYNRLRLHIPRAEDGARKTTIALERLGSTRGFGHFHLSESLFERLRGVLLEENHAYGNGHQFGQGPNWRLRVARVALSRLGLPGDLLRHGIAREVYAMPLADNLKDYLTGSATSLEADPPTVAEIGAAAVARWIVPRTMRCPEYRQVRRGDLLVHLGEQPALREVPHV